MSQDIYILLEGKLKAINDAHDAKYDMKLNEVVNEN